MVAYEVVQRDYPRVVTWEEIEKRQGDVRRGDYVVVRRSRESGGKRYGPGPYDRNDYYYFVPIVRFNTHTGNPVVKLGNKEVEVGLGEISNDPYKDGVERGLFATPERLKEMAKNNVPLTDEMILIGNKDVGIIRNVITRENKLLGKPKIETVEVEILTGPNAGSMAKIDVKKGNVTSIYAQPPHSTQTATQH
ncbi:MAG: hypothetical protein QW530_00385 [Candidatus Micrarchaeaceae archaeon]